MALALVGEADESRRLHMIQACEDQDGLLALLKSEVDHNMTVDGAKALVAGERALELSALIGTPSALALGHWSFALGLTVQGEFGEALEHYQQARSLYQSIGDEISAHRVSTRKVQALAITGRFEEALSLAQAIREGFKEQGLQPDEARVANNIGIILKRLGRYDEAIPTLQTAKRIFEDLNDPAGIALTHQNLADAYAHLDRFQEALEHVEAAAALFKRLGQTNNLAGALVEKALLHRREGRLASVLDTLSQARALFEGLGHSADAAFAQLEEARIHLDLNLLDEAELLVRDVIQTFAAKDMQLEELEASTVLGTILAKSGQTDEAALVLRHARDGWLSLGNSVQAAWSNIYIATFMLEHVQPDLAAVATYLQEARHIFDEAQLSAGQALSRVLDAQQLFLHGQFEDAQAQLMDAEAFVASLDIPDITIRASRLGGQLALARDHPDAAEAYFLRAIEALEGVRASLGLDEFKTAYFGEKQDVYTDLIGLLIEHERVERAFHFVERSKSRALLDLIGKGVNLPAESDHPHVSDLQKQLEQARADLNRDYLSAEQTAPSNLAWEQIRHSEARVMSLIRDIERLTPQDASFEAVNVPSAEQVIATLEQDTLIVEYVDQGSELIAFLIGKNGIHMRRHLGPTTDVSQALERLSFTLSRVAQGQVYEQVYGADVLNLRTNTALKTLYDLLIRPLELDLAGEQLIIVPHGVLHNVPFAALYDGHSYLIDKALIALAPSTAVYLHCRAQRTVADGSVVAFGVPFEDIPFVRDEVEAVASIFPETHSLIGPEATLATFGAQASSASVLHIATHGLYRPDNPLFSGLRFHDGWLAARDLYNLELNSSLVVLSACETGLSARQSSDELFGLARGFFFAGTPSLIVSLWAVKDTPTSQLMVAFYSALKERLSVAQALRRAQHVVRESYPNPYYWAAFNVVGDPSRPIIQAA